MFRKFGVILLYVLVIGFIAVGVYLAWDFIEVSDNEASLLDAFKMQKMAEVYPELKPDLHAAIEDGIITRGELSEISVKYDGLIKREALHNLIKGE